MKNCRILLLFCLVFPQVLKAQIYSGKVSDNDSGFPIINANVFLAGTLTGTTTNKSGRFSFNSKGNHSVPIVISFVGYKTKIISPDILVNDSVIRLEKEIQNINEINVKAGKSGWSRNKMILVFRDEFLGTSFNAKACKIKNEEDIYLFYNNETKTLHARSKKPLLIENKQLGYEVNYSLEYFKKTEPGLQFKGFSRFEEQKFRNDRQKKKIEMRRRETYLGSIMHFIRFLYHQNLAGNDTVYDLATIAGIYEYHLSYQKWLSDNYTGGDLSMTSVVSKNEVNNIYPRKWEDKFQMYDDSSNYLSGKKLLINVNGKRQICFDDTVQIVYLGNLRTSYLIPRSDTIRIFENGYYNPEKITWFGEMIKSRVGDMLPLDYEYNNSILSNKK